MRTQGTGSVRPDRRAGAWRLVYNGKSKTIEAGSKCDAELALPDFIKEINTRDGKRTGNSFAEIFNVYTLADLREQDAKDQAGVVRKYQKHIQPFFGALDVGAITAQDIDRYKRRRLQATHTAEKKRYSNASINREFSIIHRTLELARQQGIIQYVLPIPKLKEAKPRQGSVSESMYREFLAELPDYAKLPWAFAYHTGVRKGELLTFEWRWLDWDEWILNLPNDVTKNGEMRWIPIYRTSAADDHWRQLLRFAFQTRNEHCPALFQHDGEALTDWYLRTAFEGARARLRYDKVIIHDLRRTAVGNMIAAGIPESDAMRVSGHKTRSVFDRYNIHSAEAAKRVRDRMTAHNVAKAESLGASLGANEEENDPEKVKQNVRKLN